eukprot:CAMPEP_0201554210 /NCGR_PEP_ID=MMETSP0173_2-20130828/38855_1 /ASSEMBLY_ACC=CAM_ASM_000268 /TAXON_ID=218659 /ORGANISM="Vexillifera sp., Strain DIVA3 564/2" /LENGTH=524 /DNA_ID=CAMNT_0047965409 /DNA_START=89 /DNA_END=1661 /DNA_ORIENTATION=-
MVLHKKSTKETHCERTKIMFSKIPAITYSEELSLGVLVGTWNVGDKKPQPSELKDWLNVHYEHVGGSQYYDIIAVGVQECFYKVEVAGESDPCEAHWINCLRHALGDRYTLISHLSVRESIRLCVFVKSSLEQYVSNVEIGAETLTFPVGFRKGGTAVSFELFDSSFCFLNCHLTAHAGLDYVAERNADIATLFDRVRTGNKHFNISNQFHYLFWFGDLNYRFNTKSALKQKSFLSKLPFIRKTKTQSTHKTNAPDRNDIVRLIKAGEWSELQKYDQLLDEKRKGNVLTFFLEGTQQKNKAATFHPKFQPTYPFDQKLSVDKQFDENGDRVYLDPAKKRRVPAWCDRILVRFFPGIHCRPLTYQCYPKVLSSDHAPVNASFRVRARRYQFSPEHDAHRFVLRIMHCEIRQAYPMFNTHTQRTCTVLALHSACMENPVSSPMVVTTNGALPQWSSECTPDMVSVPISLDMLREQHLLVSVYDYASTEHFFRVGQGVWSLHKLELDEQITFSIKLQCRGVATTTLF